MGLGARGFLSKPIAPEELAVSIESLLHERAAAVTGLEVRRPSAASGVS
jgi:DNA-binding response OmpR family regulator